MKKNCYVGQKNPWQLGNGDRNNRIVMFDIYKIAVE